MFPSALVSFRRDWKMFPFKGAQLHPNGLRPPSFPYRALDVSIPLGRGKVCAAWPGRADKNFRAGAVSTMNTKRDGAP